MKTVDLIPFILLELADGEKYGIELTKDIETKSNGRIEIKQPTLYTILKKLEKSKFIASFWQDSDIGGKRHYYRLTPNGRLQVSTLPSYETLLNNLNLEQDEDEQNAEQPLPASQPSETPKKEISFLDLLEPSVEESVLPTTEVFNNSTLDDKTNLEINTDNLDCVKNAQETVHLDFAENKDVAKFVTNVKPNTNISNEVQPDTEFDEFEEFNLPNPVCNTQSIEFREYRDFKKDKQFLFAKAYTKVLCVKSLLFGLGTIILSILFLCLTKFMKANFVTYAILIACIAFGVLYSFITVSKREVINEEFENKLPNLNFKMRFVIASAVILLAIVVAVFANIRFGKTTLSQIFDFNNFLNFYAIIILAILTYFDWLFLYFKDKKLKSKMN